MLYTLYPLLMSSVRNHFVFLSDMEAARRNTHNTPILLVVRFFKHAQAAKAPSSLDFWDKARQSYNRIAYLDDHASAAETTKEVFSHVDLYYKKQLLRDRSRYLRPIYGKRLYAHHYHETNGIADSQETILPGLTTEEVAKLRLAWTLGIGAYPKTRIKSALLRRLEPFFGVSAAKWVSRAPRTRPIRNRRLPEIQARFSANLDRETVAFHRRLFQEAAARRPQLFRTGWISQKAYNREVSEVAGVLSPFGWGEVCFRDFESILGGSVLVKPDMGHVECWPDIYRGNQTYLSVDWDAESLEHVAERVISEKAEMRAIAESAYDRLSNAYRQVEHRATQFLDEITDGT